MTLAEAAQIAQSASIILAALFAIYGFDAWRREHIGKRRIELAEEVLALFYQARDAIAAIRSPLGFEGEGKTRKSTPNERPEDKDGLDQAYVLIERYNSHSELFSRIHSLRYRVMAQLGLEAAKPFDSLNEIVHELIISARRMSRLNTRREWASLSAETEEKNHREYMEIHSIYYGTGGADDPISPRVKQAVSDIERTCRSIIESQGTLFAIFNARWRKGG
jgi:hypothetical protein